MRIKIKSYPVLILKNLILILLVFPLFAFNINNYRHFNINDGLLDNSIVDITKDQFGQLWVVTKSSVSIFNGSHWKNYSSKFQHEGNPFNLFLIPYKRIIIDSDNKKYLLSTSGKVFLLESEKLLELFSPLQTKGISFKDIQLVNEGSKKILWASIENLGLTFFDGNGFTFGINEGLISENIIGIKSIDDLLLILTDKGIQFIGNKKIIYSYPTNYFENSRDISIAFDKKANVKSDIFSV